MRLFNTLTNKKEEFKPIEEGKVSIYICGPTVYNHAHIGNTRPMIVFDVLRRTFEYLGNEIRKEDRNNVPEYQYRVKREIKNGS